MILMAFLWLYRMRRQPGGQKKSLCDQNVSSCYCPSRSHVTRRRLSSTVLTISTTSITNKTVFFAACKILLYDNHRHDPFPFFGMNIHVLTKQQQIKTKSNQTTKQTTKVTMKLVFNQSLISTLLGASALVNLAHAQTRNMGKLRKQCWISPSQPSFL